MLLYVSDGVSHTINGSWKMDGLENSTVSNDVSIVILN